ncbi:hypothetical protein BGX31_008126 [Mortierella sp. GBA43]|nr:hypothetical protein BGX31_008126 [Mortierella sp. GBA43]
MFRYTTVAASTVFTLLVACLLNFPSTHAQPFQPTITEVTYYAFKEGQGLYIGGGIPHGAKAPINQSFMLDLSVSWDIQNPKYTALPNAPAGSRVPSALSYDGKRWMMCVNSTCSACEIGIWEWKPLFTVSGSSISNKGAVDPETGLIYIPKVTFSDATAMMVVNMETAKYERRILDPGLAKAGGFSTVWSASAKKLFLFGGTLGDTVPLTRFTGYSYNVADGWTNLTMKGSIPSPRFSGCLTPAYGGTKLVYFGGFNNAPIAVYPDIYILDVASMTWTKGADAAIVNQRGDAACAVSGDYFIVWGGRGDNSTKDMINPLAIYDIKANVWTPNYNAAPATDGGDTNDSGNSNNSTSPQSSSNSTRTIIIVVVVLGVLAILGVVALFVRRARRKRMQDPHTALSEPMSRIQQDRNPQVTLESLARNASIDSVGLTTLAHNSRPLEFHTTDPYDRKMDKLPPYEQHGRSPALMPSTAGGYSNSSVSGFLPDDQCVRRNPVEITTTHYNDSNFNGFFPVEPRNPQSCP